MGAVRNLAGKAEMFSRATLLTKLSILQLGAKGFQDVIILTGRSLLAS